MCRPQKLSRANCVCRESTETRQGRRRAKIACVGHITRFSGLIQPHSASTVPVGSSEMSQGLKLRPPHAPLVQKERIIQIRQGRLCAPIALLGRIIQGSTLLGPVGHVKQGHMPLQRVPVRVLIVEQGHITRFSGLIHPHSASTVPVGSSEMSQGLKLRPPHAPLVQKERIIQIRQGRLCAPIALLGRIIQGSTLLGPVGHVKQGHMPLQRVPVRVLIVEQGHMPLQDSLNVPNAHQARSAPQQDARAVSRAPGAHISTKTEALSVTSAPPGTRTPRHARPALNAHQARSAPQQDARAVSSAPGAHISMQAEALSVTSAPPGTRTPSHA